MHTRGIEREGQDGARRVAGATADWTRAAKLEEVRVESGEVEAGEGEGGKSAARHKTDGGRATAGRKRTATRQDERRRR